MMAPSPIAQHRATFRAFARTVVPEAAGLDEPAWAELEATVEYALSRRPPAVVTQLGSFLLLLDRAPVLRWGRRFRLLGDTERARVVEALQRAPIRLVRRGVCGLRTLVLMGYYTRAAAMAEIGYRANASGWRRDAGPARP
jgi:hypothetical protein